MQLAASDVVVNSAGAGGAAITVGASVKLSTTRATPAKSARAGAERTTTGAGAMCTSGPGAMQHTAGAGTVLTAGTGTTHSTTRAGAATTAEAGPTYPDWRWHRERRESWCDAVPRRCSCCTYCVSWTNVLHHTCGYCNPDNAPCVKVAATTVRPCVPYVFFLT